MRDSRAAMASQASHPPAFLASSRRRGVGAGSNRARGGGELALEPRRDPQVIEPEKEHGVA